MAPVPADCLVRSQWVLHIAPWAQRVLGSLGFAEGPPRTPRLASPPKEKATKWSYALATHREEPLVLIIFYIPACLVHRQGTGQCGLGEVCRVAY